MNLLELRTQFAATSGRFDLVDQTTFANLGADFYINEGSKHLDRLEETQKSWASCFRFVEIGRSTAVFPYCRAIKEVWAASISARWQLEKKSLQDLVAGYLAGTPTSRTNGVPAYFSPCLSRYVPENATVLDIEAFIGFVDIPSGNAYNYNAVILNVPTSERIFLEIKGLFYSMTLVNDTDKNYWSEVHPLLLIMATMRQIEVVNRNTQGVNDWDAAIEGQMRQLGFDLVEELIAEVDQMGG